MRSTFSIKPLIAAIAALTATSLASAAGLGRSGQDTTAFFQDGTYAEATYTYIDADVTGHDKDGNEIKDIAEDYDFFRYGVKTDINDTFSFGVLYDEPWGASANYSGDNNFTGVADKVVGGAIRGIADSAIANTKGKIKTVEQLQATVDPRSPAGQVYGLAHQGLNQTLNNFQGLSDQPTFDKFNSVVAESQTNLEASKQALGQVAPYLDEKTAQTAQALVASNEQDLKSASGARNAVQNLANITDPTKVEVRSESLTALLGMKLGQEKNFQIYGGPVAQRIEADVHLRGNAYEGGAGYDLNVNPDIDYGWIAGFQYSKPEIALKAALTYRSEIDHDVKTGEAMPLAILNGVNPVQSNSLKVTTPESVNFDFQTGINSTTLATASVRWVPWGDFAISPNLYDEAASSKLDANGNSVYPGGLNLVDYSDDQWTVELGLAKRLNPVLAISGTVGWDSGAGDPTTSLGPIEGYYSVGAGAKYNVTDKWAISAGGKYLWFGDAEGEIPNRHAVSDFEDNDGFVLGVKLSYQDL